MIYKFPSSSNILLVHDSYVGILGDDKREDLTSFLSPIFMIHGIVCVSLSQHCFF